MLIPIITTLWLGCARSDDAGSVRAARAPLSLPAPADHGTSCLDVGLVRACFDGARDDAHCRQGRCLVPRPASPPGIDAARLRCAGQGVARRCDERARDATPFACQDGTCVQDRARAPDNAEWECAELDGAMLCLRVADAAGIPDGALDPAFVCGARPSGERVCVDFAPDRPALAGNVRCRVTYAGGTRRRTCALDPRPGLGDACGDDAMCPRDALCVAGRCLPPRPAPGCWLDADCGTGGRCRWGSCVRA